MPEIKVPRRPLAFGMWEWGPLPGSSMRITWDGTLGNPAGARLLFGVGNTWRPITHPAASGVYQTVKDADAAVQAFTAAVLKAEEEDGYA